MTNEEILKELESLVTAMEESLAIISGSVAAISEAPLLLKNLLSAKHAIEQQHGENEWRDRLMRSSLRIVALKSRPAAESDPALKSLITSVLEGQHKKSDMH